MKNQNLQTLIVIIILFLGISSTQSLKAQSEFGLKGGILFSNIHHSESNSNLEIERKTGLTIGAFYKKQNLLGAIGIQTELLYQQKGANYFIPKPGTDSISDGENNYPLPDSYYRDTEKLFGYLFSLNNRRADTGEINHFSAGIAAGLSIKLCASTNLDFRYSYDLTPFDYMSSGKYSKFNNHGFAITIQQTIFNKE